MMTDLRPSSREKRARFRGTLVKVKLSPTRKERIRLAKASVRKFKDQLVLAGYDPKRIEKLLAGWDGNPKTDPLEALINPKRESESVTIGGVDVFGHEPGPLAKMKTDAEHEAELADASKRSWLHRFDEVK